MPVVTQTRDLPWLDFDPQYWSIKHFGGDTGDVRFEWDAEHDILPQGSQTTTSFRTRRGQISDLDDPEFLQQTSGSHLGLIRELKQREREDVGRFGNTDRFGKPYDTGHEFSTEKRSIVYGSIWNHHIRRNLSFAEDLHYVGPCFPYILGNPWPTLPDVPSSQINSNGARLIRKTIPTSPIAGLAAFFGELREGLPSLPVLAGLRHGTVSRGAGAEYLNTQFGVKPLIGDLSKMALAVAASKNLLKQLKRDSGAQVRRRSSLQDANTEQDLDVSGTSWFVYSPRRNLQSQPASTFYDPSVSVPVLTAREYTQSRVWFSGAYQYYLADANDLIGRIEEISQKADYLLGIGITPDVVWQITPWSWLVDWFADVGTLLFNASRLSSDSLVLRYGYVMHESIVTREYRASGFVPRDGGQFPSSMGVSYTIHRKERHRATPYGFGIDMGALSATQSAILAALGLTKAPGVLRL